jgi:Nitrate and nitrite sensing
VLIIIVAVPSMTLVPLLGSGDYQLATQWQAEKAQMGLATSTVGPPAATLLLSLEQERRLTAESQADPGTPSRDKLANQRAVTDQAVSAFRPLATLDNGQIGLANAIAGTERSLDLLAQQRQAVDAGSSSQQKAFDYYSGTIESNLSVFTALSHSANGEVTSETQTLVDLFWAVDMIGREDAILARGWKTGHLTSDEYGLVVDAIAAQKYLLQSRVAPSLTGNESDQYRTLTASTAWETKTALGHRRDQRRGQPGDTPPGPRRVELLGGHGHPAAAAPPPPPGPKRRQGQRQPRPQALRGPHQCRHRGPARRGPVHRHQLAPHRHSSPAHP